MRGAVRGAPTSTRLPPEQKPTPLEQLYARVADAEGVSRALAKSLIQRFHAEVPEVVWAMGRLALPHFISLSVRRRKGRRIMNPATRKPMRLKGGRAVHVRASASWRRR